MSFGVISYLNSRIENKFHEEKFQNVCFFHLSMSEGKHEVDFDNPVVVRISDEVVVLVVVVL